MASIRDNTGNVAYAICHDTPAKPTLNSMDSPGQEFSDETHGDKIYGAIGDSKPATQRIKGDKGKKTNVLHPTVTLEFTNRAERHLFQPDFLVDETPRRRLPSDFVAKLQHGERTICQSDVQGIDTGYKNFLNLAPSFTFAQVGAIPASDNIERGEGLLANTAPSMPAAPVGPGVFRTGSPPSRPSVHATHPVTSLYQDRQDFGYGTTATYDFVDCADLLAAERCEFPLGIAAPSEEFVNATSGLNNFTLFQVVRSGFANPTALAFANNDLGLGGDSPTYFTCLAGQTLHDNNNNNNNGDNSSSTPNSQQIMPHDSAIYRPLSTVANNRIVDESYNLSSSLTHLVFASNHQSENYKGNANLLGNQSASIPEYESCALWITNLNLFSTEEAYHQLLFAARGCGKVYACVINPPDKTKGHTTCAAKLVFWDRSGALELRRRAAAGLFIVRGYIPKVVYNRIRTASQRPGPESRVIHIDGPKCIVDKEVLLRFFASRFNFQTDEVVLLSEEPGQDGRRRLEWRFGSYRCQAASALKHIDDQRRRFPPGIGPQYDFWRQVQTYYGVDPCAPAFVPFGLQ